MTTRDLKPEHITAICDTREQLPFDLSPIKTIRSTIVTGDYSVLGLSHCIAVERKSLADLVGCIGNDRERFEKEIQRLMAYETRAIIVEGSWLDLETGHWRSRVFQKPLWALFYHGLPVEYLFSWPETEPAPLVCAGIYYSWQLANAGVNYKVSTML